MQRILYFILFVVLVQKGIAQDTIIRLDPTTATGNLLSVDSIKYVKGFEHIYPERNRAGYAELGGNGLGFSINYEHLMLMKKKKDYIVFKIGAGYFPYKGENYLSIPMTVGKLYRRKKHFLETGIGAVLYKSFKEEIDFNITGTLGYRRYIKKNTYYYKIAFTPFISFTKETTGNKKLNYDISPFVGFGFGKFF